jgi:hypothetical protein
MWYRVNKQLLSLLTFLICITFLLSCANLQAIRDFANISSESAQYTVLVNDYVESPERQKRFSPSSEHELLDHNKRIRVQQKEVLLAYHKAISDYMEALGQLAAGRKITWGQIFC